METISVTISKKAADFLREELNVTDLTPQVQQMVTQLAKRHVHERFKTKKTVEELIDEIKLAPSGRLPSIT